MERKIATVLLAMAPACAPGDAPPPSAGEGAAVLAQAYQQHKSNVLAQGEGVVVRILRDDTQGARHQRFLLRLESGQTVLIAHNIDVAPRVEEIEAGDRVAFRGEYEWNEQGGVIHWTHRTEGSAHADGWLEHAGRRYW
jgi:hypothetical protein